MVTVPVPSPNEKPVFFASMPLAFIKSNENRETCKKERLFGLHAFFLRSVHGNRASFLQPRRKHILKPISLPSVYCLFPAVAIEWS